MLDAQERSISEVETGLATRLVGTEGGVPSTMMVVSAVELPLLFVAVRVYVRVEVGVIVIEPVEVAD